MTPFEILVFSLGIVFLFLPVFWAWRLVSLYLGPRQPMKCGKTALPRAAVILPLRGADPSLRQCLRGLLDQDYPHYQVHIVFDSPEDPAGDLVQEILAEGHRQRDVRVSVLRRRHDTCSLKVSAQIEVIEGLEPDVDVVAFIDADVIPGPGWLRSLVEPLDDPRVGATTGIRWYAPAQPYWGSLVRFFWNAGACSQMYAFHIPWGGSLAVHARVFRNSDLLEQWSHSFGEDTRAYGVLRSMGVELRFVPAVTMVNNENIDLKGCCTFIRRQLFSARMNHANWGALCVASLGTALALVTATAGLLAGFALGHAPWIVAAGGLLGGYGLGLASALVVGDKRIRALARQQGQLVPAHAFSWRHLPALLLTQCIHFFCLVWATRLRCIDWRGVTYTVVSPGKLRMLEYRPYRSAATEPVTARSLL